MFINYKTIAAVVKPIEKSVWGAQNDCAWEHLWKGCARRHVSSEGLGCKNTGGEFLVKGEQ